MAKAPQSDEPDDGSAGKARQAERSATSDLASRIAQARRDGSGGQSERSFARENLTGASKAFRYASEFIAAIIVGAVLGYTLDAWLGTTPWGMIVLLLVGFAAGVLNVIRVANEANGAVGTPSQTGSVPDDEDED